LLRRGLHPRANQRNKLSNGEKLKVAVFQGAKSCRQLWNRSLPASSMRGNATSHDAASSGELSRMGLESKKILPLQFGISQKCGQY
jgi:hypothetical protein